MNYKFARILDDLCEGVERCIQEEREHWQGHDNADIVIERRIKQIINNPVAEWTTDRLAKSAYQAGYERTFCRSLLYPTKKAFEFIDRLEEAFKRTNTYRRYASLPS